MKNLSFLSLFFVLSLCSAQLFSGENCQVSNIEAGGDSNYLLLKGQVLLADKIISSGEILIDNSDSGNIICVAESCLEIITNLAVSPVVVNCGENLISPGFINAHDHITFSHNSPGSPIEPHEKFSHRHDWRVGLRGHKKIRVPKKHANGDHVAWGELRHLLAGTTSTSSSGYRKGLLRNLDSYSGLEGLNADQKTNSPTFPLGDTRGFMAKLDCPYKALIRKDSKEHIKLLKSLESQSYTPHISEGLDTEARNEFLCLTQEYDNGMSILGPNSSLIHGVGLTSQDYLHMAQKNINLIWSPRSNIYLYGDTVPINLIKTLGIKFALGTDWTPSGSMNILRELKCAQNLNQKYFNSKLTSKDLWLSVTKHAAEILGFGNVIGELKENYKADIVIVKNNKNNKLSSYSKAINANPQDIVMTMRGGKILYSDFNITNKLDKTYECEKMDVCGAAKNLCIREDIGKTHDILTRNLKDIYPLFFCKEDPNEPSCVPSRKTYTGQINFLDLDGDGIENQRDNCPQVFNPGKSVDFFKQADTDQDHIGDVCDKTPFDNKQASSLTDYDLDGIKDVSDNCPRNFNKSQRDSDSDQVGDLCDACPNFSNLNQQACMRDLSQIKQGNFKLYDKVAIGGVTVTKHNKYGFFVQNSNNNYAGIYVFTDENQPKPPVDSFINLKSARVQKFYRQIQLFEAIWEVIKPNTKPKISNISLKQAAGTVEEPLNQKSPYEGMLVKLSDSELTVTKIENFGEDEEAKKQILTINNLINFSPTDTTNKTYKIGDKITLPAGVLAWRFGKLELLN